jgi:hypothetical protein
MCKRSIESKVAALEKEAGRQASVKEIQAITKESRPIKEIPNREALFREWRETGKAFCFDPKALVREPKKEHEVLPRKDAHDICRSATHILSYRRNITERDVFQAVLSSSKGRIRSEDIKRFTKEYTKLYLSRLPPHDEKKEERFTLNRLGLELACEINVEVRGVKTGDKPFSPGDKALDIPGTVSVPPSKAGGIQGANCLCLRHGTYRQTYLQAPH